MTGGQTWGSTRLPAVSVVLPTHDRVGLLSRAVASVLSQEEVHFELLIVDDGSADATPEALARLDDERVRSFRLEPARGVAAARNLAIEEARGEWVAFLDDDDFWGPQKLRRQLDAVTDDRIVLVYTQAIVLDEGGRATRETQAAPPRELERALLGTNTIGTPSGVMARREDVRSLGGFDGRLSTFADWDLWLRLVERGRAALVDEPLFAYVEHSAGMNVAQIDTARGELRYLARKHRDLCRSKGVRFGSVHLSRWLISRYRPAGRRVDAAREYASVALRERRPRDLGRALGMLLGERVTGLGRRVARPETPAAPPARVPEPAWLAAALAGEAFSGETA